MANVGIVGSAPFTFPSLFQSLTLFFFSDMIHLVNSRIEHEGKMTTSKGTISEGTRELQLLEVLEENPEIKQVDLAAQLGVAVGTVNWLLKRLAAKGYVKVKRVGQWRWRYLLTPQGVTAKAKLTKFYIQRSMQLYRETRQRAQELLGEVQKAGYDRVRIVGDAGNDLVDVCRLTCLEQRITIIEPGRDGGDKQPVLHIDGQKLSLEWPEEEGISD
jgi:DNA-binding MarR family transcriptional regulator